LLHAVFLGFTEGWLLL